MHSLSHSCYANPRKRWGATIRKMQPFVTFPDSNCYRMPPFLDKPKWLNLVTHWGKSCFKDMSFCVLSKAFLTDVSEQKRIQHAEVSVSVFSTSFADFLVDHDGRRQEGYLGPVRLQPQEPAFWLVSDKLYIFLPQLGP